ncbi:hypothetical protein L345_12209, partial [Ophiophagus hannah]
MVPAQALAPQPQPPPARANTPLPFKPVFDGTASKLACFLNRAWSYSDHHGDEFHDRVIVSILSDNLEEEASEWFTQVHDEGAPELDNIDDFLRALQARFEGSAQAQEAEAEIKMMKQKGWPAKEIVKEFLRLAGRLSNWPEQILVHYFKECLDEEDLPTPHTSFKNKLILVMGNFARTGGRGH